MAKALFLRRLIIKHYLLIFIFLLALTLRFYRLSEFPVGFHIDEVIIGDTAYSLLLTGKDYDGRVLPMSVEVFKDYIPAGYHYLDILPVKFFGLNEFATRFPGALFGALTIFSIYLLSLLIFKRQSVSILSALLVTLSPWHIILSRGTSETLVSLFFVVSGFALLIFALEKRKLIHLVSATLLLALSFFFYHTPRVFVPIMYFVILAVYFWDWKSVKMKSYFIGSFLFLSLLSFFLVFLVGGGTNRFNQTSIFSYQETKLVMDEQIREDGVLATPAKISRLFHNKPTSYSLTFFSNYFQYFSADFLFINGGKPIIFSVPGMGLFYLVELPFLLIGLVSLVTSKNRLYLIPILWIVFGPFVAALTADDSPNIRRAIVLFPMLEIVSAYGLVLFLERFKGRLKVFSVLIVGFLMLFNVSYFIHQYFVHTKIHRTWDRNNGYKTMVQTINAEASKYDKIVITKSKGSIWPDLLFYSKYDPTTYQKEGATRDNAYTGFGKYFFVPEVCPSMVKDSKYPKGKVLFVEHGEDCKIPPKGKNYQYIYREDGTKAFRLVY